MAGIFGEFFLVSVSHEAKHENSSKNSGKIRSKIRGKNSGRKFEKFGKDSFCNFSDITFCALLQTCVCALLRSFVLFCACFCVRPRLERPHLGTAEGHVQYVARFRWHFAAKLLGLLCKDWQHFWPSMLLPSPCSIFWEWPRYCRKVYWTKMVQTTILVKMTLFRTGF